MRIKEKVKDLKDEFEDKFFYIFIKKLFTGIVDDEVMASGAALTYYFILSIFPLLIFLLGVISFTSLVGEDVVTTLLRILPNDARNVVGGIVNELISTKSETLVSTSIILSLWTGSLGISGLFKAINKAYDTQETRNYFTRKFLSIIFTIALAVLMIIVLSTLVFGQLIATQIFAYFGAEEFFYQFWQTVRLIVPILSMVFMFTALYMIGPSTKKFGRVKLRFAIPGAVFTTVGWILTSLVFSFYVKNFGNYTTTYGSLGGIIILLVWLNLTNVIIVIGAEINGAYRTTCSIVSANKNNKTII